MQQSLAAHSQGTSHECCPRLRRLPRDGGRLSSSPSWKRARHAGRRLLHTHLTPPTPCPHLRPRPHPAHTLPLHPAHNPCRSAWTGTPLPTRCPP
eukprot:360647-Chlamydomonas_euryale.AAC.5